MSYIPSTRPIISISPHMPYIACSILACLADYNTRLDFSFYDFWLDFSIDVCRAISGPDICCNYFFLPFQYIVTDFGMQIMLSARYYFQVTLPSTFSSVVCGFCGNLDGDSTNDLIIGPFEPCASTFGVGSPVRQCKTVYGPVRFLENTKLNPFLKKKKKSPIR